MRSRYAVDALFCPNCGTAKLRDLSQDPLIGTTVGDRYLLHERVGMGASGTIYRAEHVTLRRKIAVKVLHHELSRDDLAVERFRRQATTVGDLENEHIVQIHDFGRTADERLYLAMEYLDGETLDERIAARGRLDVDEAVDIAIQLGDALMEAHAIGYVHRDLRPRNLFLAVRRGKANFVKLLDFGLSKLVSEGEAASTSLGMTFGDPHYMSPEQARGEPIDRRADIYSMGCIAYQMLVGEPPFVGGRVFEVLSRHVEEAPIEPASRAEVPAWLNQTVMRCLDKSPERRFITVFRLVEALRDGLTTGSVMDEERARSHESEPPPSVSRAMERLGDRLDADGRVEDADDTRGAELDSSGATSLGLGAPSALAAAIDAAIDAEATAPTPAPEMAMVMTASEAVPTHVPVEPTPAPRVPGLPPPVVRAPSVPGVIAQPSADVAASEAEDGSSVSSGWELEGETGSFVSDAIDEYDDDEYDDDDEYEDDDEESTTSAAGKSFRRRDPGNSASGISGAWYADGDALADSGVELADDEAAQLREARGTGPSQGLSATDEVYLEEPPSRVKWVILAVAAIALVAFVIILVRAGGQPDETETETGTAESAEATADEEPAADIPAATSPYPDAAAAAGPAAADAGTPPVAPSKAAEPKPTAIAARESDRRDREDRAKAAADRRAAAAERAAAKRVLADRIAADKAAAERAAAERDAAARAAADKPSGDEPTGDEKPSDTPANDEPADDKPSEEDKKRADFFAQVGAKHLTAGDVLSAAKEFRKALGLNPSNGRAVTGFGEIAMRQGNFAAAVKHLERAARLRSGSSRVHALLGDAYLGAGKKSAAAESFKRALRINPDSERARRGLQRTGD